MTTPTTPSTGPRIVAIESYAQWTGTTESQDFLEIPASMDLDAEEKAWFAAGGDSSGNSFAEYLVGKGAKPVIIEKWAIRYQ